MNRKEREALIVDNMPLVRYLALDLYRRANHLSLDDLISVGSVALISSVDAYDPSFGVPFGAFATRRIKGSFMDEARTSDWATRGTRKRIKEVISKRDEMTHALGRTPTDAELSQNLGITKREVAEALEDSKMKMFSLESLDLDFVSIHSPNPESAVIASEMNDAIQKAVAALPEKLRRIIEQVYFEDRPVKDIAAELGITHSAVSQQRTEAIKLMGVGLTKFFSSHFGTQDSTESRVNRRRDAYLSELSASVGGTAVESSYIL